MLSQAQIRSQLNSLVSKKLSLDDFEDWFVVESWNAHISADPVVQALVGIIELRLAEHSSGHLPFEQMMNEFRSLGDGVIIINVRINAEPIKRSSGSSISIGVAGDVQLGDQNAERQPLRVYA